MGGRVVKREGERKSGRVGLERGREKEGREGDGERGEGLGR